MQTEEELRILLSKMKNREWSDVFLVLCDLSRLIDSVIIEGKRRGGKKLIQLEFLS